MLHQQTCLHFLPKMLVKHLLDHFDYEACLPCLQICFHSSSLCQCQFWVPFCQPMLHQQTCLHFLPKMLVKHLLDHLDYETCLLFLKICFHSSSLCQCQFWFPFCQPMLHQQTCLHFLPKMLVKHLLDHFDYETCLLFLKICNHSSSLCQCQFWVPFYQPMLHQQTCLHFLPKMSVKHLQDHFHH